jgi:hypothetical protein
MDSRHREAQKARHRPISPGPLLWTPRRSGGYRRPPKGNEAIDDDETDDEIERILAIEFFENEYQGSGDDQAMGVEPVGRQTDHQVTCAKRLHHSQASQLIVSHSSIVPAHQSGLGASAGMTVRCTAHRYHSRKIPCA